MFWMHDHMHTYPLHNLWNLKIFYLCEQGLVQKQLGKV